MNRSLLNSPRSRCSSFLASLLGVLLLGAVVGAPAAHAQSVSFSSDGLNGVNLGNPTSLQFGPDDRLYVSQQNGEIKAFTIERNGPGDYDVTDTETIDLVQNIPNHNDDGTASGTNNRQVTGIVVAGTPSAPVLYVSSSDPRVGAGGGGSDLGLDTNSGIVSRLTFNGAGWDIVHLVRGLPRSEENHASNGLQLDEQANVLYLAQGGHANAGSPSNNFAFTNEYALSAAVLSIDLDAIDALPTKTDAEGQQYKYDLPTLDDPERANESDGSDPGDPFGGNNGLNMAKVVENGPVQVYSPGYRNPYDLVLTEGGKMYVMDNGANNSWGGFPEYEESEDCTNRYLTGEPGSTGPGPDPGTYPSDVTLLPGSDGQPDAKVNNRDNLHYVPGPGFYGGHPNPIRANPVDAGLYTRDGSGDNGGVFRDGSDPNHPLPADWPAVPVSLADPVQCDFRNPGEGDGALHTWGSSTNGITEYTASNFGDALKGNLLTASFNGTVYRVQLSADGTAADNVFNFASGFGSKPLDVVAQGDDDVFGGTVWAATYGANTITIFEPGDYDGQDPGTCTAADDPSLDEDNDGYDNADEIDNGTNPCSASSKPEDFDGDLISDLNDPDDDGDGLLDTDDPFAIDADNGLSTALPVNYDLFNNDPGFGFGGIGFTGLMTNGSDYRDLLDPDEDLILGGTSGLFTDPSVGEGDTYEDDNSQANALQFGLDVDQGTAPFTIEAQVNGPFGSISGDYASQGLYIGTGDQENYLKVVLNDGSGSGGFQVLKEVGGTAGTDISQNASGILDANAVTLFLSVDPAASTVQAKYAEGDGPITDLGSPVSIPAAWLSSTDDRGLAVGFIATSTGPASEFAATWDYVNVTLDPVTAVGEWANVAPFDEVRHENAFVQAGDKFYLLGGRESKNAEVYDPDTETWTEGAASPTILNHFQAVELDGLIYAGMAFDDNDYPHEAPAENLYLYDPAADAWITGPQIPEARRRGSAGTFVRDGKIYFVAGIQDGHSSGHVTWFDAYDPATGAWTQLPDAPRARDHFFAAYDEGSDKLYMIGGRTSGTDGTFLGTVAEVDVYDFASGSWSTLPAGSNIPTERAAAATGMIGDEIIVAGGEREAGSAKAATEAFNVNTQSWRTLTDMLTGRHATQGIVNNGGLYVAGGSPTRGGPGSATPDLEAFYFFGETTPTGTALAASTLDAPGSLDFGAVTTGTSAQRTVTLSNTGGSQALVVEDAAVTGADFALGEAFAGPLVIAPGATLDLAVTFSPGETGPRTGTLAVTHGGGSTATVALAGEGTDELPVLARINTGGDSYTDGEGHTWEADGSFTGGQAWPENGPKTDEAIAGTEDDLLYQTERSAGTDLGSFSYAVPAPEAGTYTVNLHFAEIYWGASVNPKGSGGTGKRVFSVDIEDGQAVLTNYDINADVGPTTAAVKTFQVEVTDGTLNLDFTASTNQPKVSAIEVLGGSSGGGNQPPQVATIADQSSAEGDDISNAGLFVSATDPDGGPQNLAYSLSGQPAGVDIEPTNGQIIGAIAEGAAAGSPYTVTVTVGDGADQAQTSFTWTITAPPVAGEALYRVNAGGDSYTDGDGHTYEADADAGYFSGGKTFGSVGSPPIDGTTDDALYQTERYGGSSNASPFTYSFDVADGSYDVALHFAEVYQGVSDNGDCDVGGDCTGTRVFTVEAEGQVVLDEYDIYAAAGASATAVIETLSGIEVTDGTLDVSFDLGPNGVDNAKVSALAVFPASTGGGNQAPQITAIADQVNTEGESVSLQVDATDPDGDALTYGAELLPPGLAIDAATGLISGTIATGGQGGAFVEEGGLVVIEAESGDAPANWVEETTLSDFTGDGYLQYEGSDHFGNPGIDLIEYEVEIQTPGTYQFQWRSRAGGSSSTEENDSWLKILADSFYGEKGNGDVVCPKGFDSSQNDCTGSDPEGGGGGGWFKTYVNSTNWSWQTSTSDNDAHDLFAEFGEAGTYTIQVSGRSVGHAIDRMVLHRVGPGSPVPGNPTDPQLAESSQNGGAAAGSPYDVSVTVTDDGTPQADATESFQWTVNPAGGENTPPAIASISDRSVEEGSTLDVAVSATDAESDPIALSMEITDDGSGTAVDPGAYTFTDAGDGTASLSWTPQPGDAGAYTATVTADDGAAQATASFAILVTEPGSQAVVARINAGGGSYTDGEGHTYEADTENSYFSGGQSFVAGDAGTDPNMEIAGTDDDVLYRSERSSGESPTTFSYDIPVPAAGTYTVNLRFAEIYWGATGGGTGGAGQRVFSVDIEDGQAALTNYDINADVGPTTAVTKSYTVDVTDDALNIDFTASVNQPKVSAIEVLGAGAPPAAVASALVKVNSGGGVFASTFNNDSFTIENTGDVEITGVSFDLSSSFLPDVVFDPVGTAGDNGAKCLTPGTGESATGFVAPADACVDPFSQPHNGTDADEGYDVLSASFGDFGTGETFGFAVDIDPTSIKGDQSTGDAGAISGFELIGSAVTVTFADGTTQVTSLYDEGSAGGSQALAAAEAPAAPSIAVEGVTAPATVAEAAQTITVTGTPGATVSLLRADARLYIDAGAPDGGMGYDVDPFEANEVLARELYTATLDENGQASIDVTLTQTASPNAGPDGGLNHFIATVEGQGAQTSQTSSALVLEYDPNATGEATLAGTVGYGDGSALEGATLTMSGPNAPAPVASGSDGTFSLTAATGQSYALSASMSTDPAGISAALNSLDLVLIRRHALATQLIEDSLRILAADANGNGSVGITDVALGRQVILGGRADLGGTDAFVCTVDEGAFPDESDPFNYVASYSYDPLSGDQSGQDFRCAKRGDANGSRAGAGGSGTESTAVVASARSTSSAARTSGTSPKAGSSGAPLRLALGEAQVVEASGSSSAGHSSEAEHEVLVPVIAPTGHAHLGGYQFTLEWDAEALAFAGVEEMGLPGMNQANFFSGRALDEGRLATVWTDPQGRAQVVEEGTRLFSVRFRIKDRSATAQSAQVRFTSSLTQIFAHDGETLQALRVETADGAVELEALPERFALHGNYPNPVRDRTNISLDLPASAKVEMGVYDALGRQVMEQSEDLSAGQDQTMRLETGDLSSGVYFYRVTVRLEGGEPHVETGRFVLVR